MIFIDLIDLGQILFAAIGWIVAGVLAYLRRRDEHKRHDHINKRFDRVDRRLDLLDEDSLISSQSNEDWMKEFMHKSSLEEEH